MSSEVKYAATQFAWPTGTGNFDVTISGLGWTPKAVKLTWAYTNTNGTPANSSRYGVGFADGTNQACLAVTSGDNNSTVAVTRYLNTDCCMLLSTSSNKMTSVSAIADGWRFNRSINLPGGYLIGIEFFGGADLSAEVGSINHASTGSSSKTGMAFQPTVLFAACNGAPLSPSYRDYELFSYGVAVDGVAAVEQGALLNSYGVQGATTQQPDSRYSTDAIAGQIHDNTESWRASITSFNADGWTFSVDQGSKSSDPIIYLALDTGDRKVSVTTINAPTSSLVDWSVTGIGFKPQSVLLFPSMTEAADLNTLKTDQKAGYVATGNTDGTRMYSQATTVEDGASTTNTSRVSANKFAYLLDTSDAALFDVGLPTFEADGWTVDAADISTVQATQRKWLAFAIEEEASLTASAIVSGSATASITEADIAAGGKQIILDLTNDTWVAAGVAFDAIRQDILDGLVSAQNETNGWNNEVIPAQPVSAVVRTSDTRVTITLVAA